MGGIEYSGANLEAIYHGEGRCTPNGATAFFYEYTVKDHLGNARVNFRANGAAVTFLEELHYYPFGMIMEGIGTVATTQNKYRYNGKEMNDDFGLNWSDYGARWYDASLGRWWSVDPLGEKYQSWSPYNYVMDNPLKYIDPDGEDAIIIIKPGSNGQNGTITVTVTFNYNKDQGSNFVKSAVSSFQGTWGNGEAKNSGEVYKGKAFKSIEIDGKKYDVTYQLALHETDNVYRASEGLSIFKNFNMLFFNILRYFKMDKLAATRYR